MSEPKWMDRPDAAGLWVCECPPGESFKRTILDLDADDLKRGAPFHTRAVFGPIPSPKFCSCGKIAPDVSGICDDCFGG